MTIWDRLATRIQALFTYVRMPGRAVGERDPDVARIMARIATQAGVNITPDNALKIATVWACVTYLGRAVGQLPWRVLRELPSGKEERAPQHPVDWLIARRPNPEMGSFTFRETMVGWAARWGNACAEIVRDLRGVPIALWPIHPSRVEFERDEQGALVYKITGTDEVVLPAERVFHLRGYGEGSVGLNVVAYAAESIGWAHATELFGASFFGNGVNPSGAVELPMKLSPDALAMLKNEIAQIYAGPKNAAKVMVLDGGMKFNKISVEPEAAQFIETRQHQVEEICRWFGVPPHKVMHLLRATFSNIEHQSIEVVVDSIVPWAKRFEDEADYKLFGAVNRGGYFTKLDLKGLLRGDFKSRQEGLEIMRRAGVINANEWRRLEEMNEIGALGEKYIVEANMTTLDRVGEQPATVVADPDDDDPVERSRRSVERARQQRERTVH